MHVTPRFGTSQINTFSLCHMEVKAHFLGRALLVPSLSEARCALFTAASAVLHPSIPSLFNSGSCTQISCVCIPVSELGIAGTREQDSLGSCPQGAHCEPVWRTLHSLHHHCRPWLGGHRDADETDLRMKRREAGPGRPCPRNPVLMVLLSAWFPYNDENTSCPSAEDF